MIPTFYVKFFFVLMIFCVSACGAKTGVLSDDPVGERCIRDSECNDGLICNGVETCSAGVCRESDNPPDCDDDNPCTEDSCSEETMGCLHNEISPDLDGDGAIDQRCGGDDCDDSDPSLFPDAIEQCNDRDDNCNDLIDEPSTPLLISTVPEGILVFGTALEWTGEEFALVWHAGGEFEEPMYFVRISDRAEILSDIVEIIGPSQASFGPSMVWTGSELALGFHDHITKGLSETVELTRLIPEMGWEPVESLVANFDDEMKNPSLVWNDDGYGIAFRVGEYGSGRSQIYFARLNSIGEVQGDLVAITDDSTDSYGAELVWNESEYALAWLDDAQDEFSVYFQRISRNGQVTTDPVLIDEPTFYPYRLRMVRTPDYYFLTWTVMVHSLSVSQWIAVLDHDGTLITIEEFLPSETSTSAFIDYNDDFVGMAWIDYPGGTVFAGAPSRIRYASLRVDGEILGDVQFVSESNREVYKPRIAWAQEQFGVSWLDLSPGNEGMYFSLVCP